MKKKLLAMMLTVGLLTGLTAGCAGGNDAQSEGGESSTESGEESDVTLTLAMCGDGTTKESLDNLLLDFTEETGIKVETIYVAASWGEFTTKVQTMVGGGEKLDAAILAVEAIPKFLELGLAAPIDDWIAENQDVAQPILDDTNPKYQDSFKDAEGNTYAFPFSSNNVVMHFNTQRLAEAGLEVPDDGWTTEEFLEYCKKLTVEKDGVKQYAFALPYTEWFCSEAWLFNNGASFFSEDGTECTINSPEAVEMFTFLQDLVFKYGYAPIPEESYSAIEQLINGQVAMGSWGRWPTANYLASEFEDVAIQRLPHMSTYKEIFGVDGIFTLESSEYKEEATQLAAYISSEEFASAYLSSGNIPARESIAEKNISELGFPENYEIFYSALMSDEVKQVSCPMEFEVVTPIYNTAMSEIFVNNADVQTTLDNCAEQINAIM